MKFILSICIILGSSNLMADASVTEKILKEVSDLRSKEATCLKKAQSTKETLSCIEDASAEFVGIKGLTHRTLMEKFPESKDVVMTSLSEGASYAEGICDFAARKYQVNSFEWGIAKFDCTNKQDEQHILLWLDAYKKNL